MDKILLSDITVRAVIGVHRYEQLSAQVLSIDFAFSVKANRAAVADAIADTHDYAEIYADIISFVEKNPCRLLETLAQRLADYLKNKFQFVWMQLSITKKPVDMKQLSSVRITIER